MPRPLLRWPGGKRWLLPEILKRLPKRFNSLHEPFLGGGALTFRLAPDSGRVSDVNSELMTLYRVVRDNPSALADQLLAFDLSPETYLALRFVDRAPPFKDFDPVWRAARFLFISRCCYGGVMRVNREGWLNCARDHGLDGILARETASIHAASRVLGPLSLAEAPYTETEEHARPGDFVYLDPPYDRSRPGAFTAYTAQGFTDADQGGLADFCARLTRRGIHWMMSNADTARIRLLYEGMHVHPVSGPRRLGRTRSSANELLVTNYPCD